VNFQFIGKVTLSTKSLKSPFAIGHTAEVYSWDEGYILKLFREWFPLSAIEHEAHVANSVHNAGLSAPAVLGDIIEIDGRYGLVYERVIGVSMLETLAARPWNVLKFAHRLAELQVKMHRIKKVPGLPIQHETLKNKIQSAEMLSSDLREVAVNMLGELPQGNQLCHGDFHPDNVLMTENGAVIIDWIDATCGNPLADVARSSILLSKGHLPENKRMRWILGLFREWFHRTYLKRYFQRCPGDPKEFAAWRTVNAAGRLSERIPEEQALLAFVKTSLSQ
jgi:uncharacterized protein (TIGR02172 family)